jgi:hypothetical protein
MTRIKGWTHIHMCHNQLSTHPLRATQLYCLRSATTATHRLPGQAARTAAIDYQPQQSQAAPHTKPKTASRYLPKYLTDARIRLNSIYQATLLLNKNGSPYIQTPATHFSFRGTPSSRACQHQWWGWCRWLLCTGPSAGQGRAAQRSTAQRISAKHVRSAAACCGRSRQVPPTTCTDACCLVRCSVCVLPSEFGHWHAAAAAAQLLILPPITVVDGHMIKVFSQM